MSKADNSALGFASAVTGLTFAKGLMKICFAIPPMALVEGSSLLFNEVVKKSFLGRNPKSQQNTPNALQMMFRGLASSGFKDIEIGFSNLVGYPITGPAEQYNLQKQQNAVPSFYGPQTPNPHNVGRPAAVNEVSKIMRTYPNARPY